MPAIFLIPAGLCLAFGQMVGDNRQGWALLIARTVMFTAAVVAIMLAEQAGKPKIAALGVDQVGSALQSGSNMEGKSTRFAIAASALFSAVTTAASCDAAGSCLYGKLSKWRPRCPKASRRHRHITMTVMDNPARILVVEDDPLIRRFVRQALEEEGHQVLDIDTLKGGLIEAERGAQPLPAHLPSTPAPQARGRPGTAGALAD